MSTFEDRKKRYEGRFAHDQETRFRAEARRNRIVGLWAAQKLGKHGDEAEDYARQVIRADLKEPGDEDVFQKLRSDLPKSDVSDEDIREAMVDAFEKALAEIEKG